MAYPVACQRSPRGARGPARAGAPALRAAVRVLRRDVVYLSVEPENVAGRRCYEKVGYVLDHSCPASRYADEPTDVTMSLTREAFERRHGDALEAIAIEEQNER